LFYGLFLYDRPPACHRLIVRSVICGEWDRTLD
jgi:hypothetical protein